MSILELNVGTPVQEINQLHDEIGASARTALDKAIRCGELLTAQREELHHGQWLPWLKENVNFTQRTAWTYMQLFNHREEIKLENASNLAEASRLIFRITEEPEPVIEESTPVQEIETPDTSTQDVNGETPVIEADAVEAPVPRWEKDLHDEPVPPPSPPSTPRPAPKLDNVQAVPPLKENDWRMVDILTQAFFNRLTDSRFHQIDHVRILAHAIDRLRQLRRDLKREHEEG
jgi:hypothetical protein